MGRDAALFSVGMFAAFSIAALLGPLVHLCRQSVPAGIPASISRLEAAGDIRGMLELNSRGSVLVATLVYPLLAFAFVFSAEIVTIIYTPAYVAAAARDADLHSRSGRTGGRAGNCHAAAAAGCVQHAARRARARCFRCRQLVSARATAWRARRRAA